MESEFERAGDEFLEAFDGHSDNYESAMESAHEHAIDHAMRFSEMRDVFIAVGVAGLWHLFEKQVYRHLNKDIGPRLVEPIAHWRDAEELIGMLTFKVQDRTPVPSTELIDALLNTDLVELKNVANVVKHGQDGGSYRALVKSGSRAIGQEPELAPYNILRVSLDLTQDDIVRYRDAILRVWSPGLFGCPRDDDCLAQSDTWGNR